MQLPQLQTNRINCCGAIDSYTQIHLTIAVASVRIGVTISSCGRVVRDTVYHPKTWFIIERHGALCMAAREELFSWNNDDEDENIQVLLNDRVEKRIIILNNKLFF